MVRMNLPPHLEHLRKRVVHCGSGLGYALVTPLLAFAQGFALLGLALDVLSGAQGLEHLTALCAGEPPVGTDIWRGHTKFSETGLTLPLFRVALNPRFTRPFYAVPRTSAARTASG